MYKNDKFWIITLAGLCLATVIAALLVFAATTPRAKLNIVQFCSLLVFALLAVKLIRERRANDTNLEITPPPRLTGLELSVQRLPGCLRLASTS
jgi:hypothetical protein